MVFGNPHVLWLLLVLPPALVAFLWWAGRQRRRLMERFIQSRLLEGLTVGLSAGRQTVAMAALVAGVVLLLVALSRPQWGFTWEEAHSRGLDIVVAVDVSKSMLAEDIPPNRLARARLAVLDLVQRARTDRLGLVAFAGSAFLQCPLTIDDAAFRQSLDALDVNIIPEGGTALAAAINTALTAFKETDNYKVLVMFTDGEDHDSGALDAATKAAKAGLKIFTVGIGTAEGELLRVRDAKGRADFIRDESGNVVKSKLNEDLLRQIAGATTGGFYLPLRGAKAINTLYDQGLAPLPKSDRDERLTKRYHERYHWPLGAAILLLVFELLFPTRKPESSWFGAKGRGAVTALLMLCVLMCASAVQASSSSALRSYRQGDYPGALREYERLLQRKADDPRLHFNAGAAAYQKQAYEEALKRFSEALNSPDLNLQQSAYYNRGNAQFELGEQAADAARKSEHWKKSVQDFESALKLNPQDADAQYNRDVVKKLLEQVQPPPQQQQKQDDNKSKDQDKQQDQQQQSQQQDQQQQQENQSDQQKQQQSQESQQQEKQPSEQQQQGQNQQEQQANSQESQEQQGEQSKPQAGDKEQQAEQQKASGKPGGEERESPEGQTAGETGQAGKMSQEQARQLLDAQKGQERMLPAAPNNKRTTPRRGPFRDW